MKVKAFVEVLYDREGLVAGVPDSPPEPVVVLRFGLHDDRVSSLETQCQREGQKVLDGAPGAVRGYNHRVVITGFEIDGVPAEPKHLLVVGLKTPQKA